MHTPPVRAAASEMSAQQAAQAVLCTTHGQLAPLFAAGYLGNALEIIESCAVDRHAIDWPALRAGALAHVADSCNPADAYAAISAALLCLGDHHSFFEPPDEANAAARSVSKGTGVIVAPRENIVAVVFPGSPADQAGVRVGDKVIMGGAGETGLVVRHPEATDDITVSAPAEFSTFLPPKVARLGPAGYLLLPSFAGSPEKAREYAQIARDQITALDSNQLSGWVLDLRINTGGNGYPMMTAVAPIIGDGEAGAFVGPDFRTPWEFRGGEFFVGGVNRDLLPGGAFRMKRPNPPVAVLTGRLTVSSGEWVTIAFRGRPRTRTLGEATAGLPTANTVWGLPDGAKLVLTTAREADRAGHIYDGPLPVDEAIATDWASFGTDRDPVLNAALAWLKAQPDCGE